MRFLVLVLAVFVAFPAVATNYYWDNNGGTPGFGTAAGTWAAPTPGDNTQGWSTNSDGTTAPVNVTTLSGDSVNFGTSTVPLAAGTVAVSGSVTTTTLNILNDASGAGTITLTGGSITLAGVAPSVVVESTGNFINSAISLDAASSISFSLSTGAVGTLTLNGPISGNNNLTFTTPNISSGNYLQTIVLGSTNHYSGATRITTGNINNTLRVQAAVDNALPTTTVLILDGGAGAGSGRTVSYDLHGHNQILAGLANSTNVGPLRNQTIINSGTGTPTLTVGDSHDYIFGDPAKITGGIALTKQGSGRLSLTSANTFTGDTTITAGVLQVDGSLASATEVGNGATLAGSGQVNAAVTVDDGGSVTAGDGANGTLTISSLTFNARGTNNIGDLSGYTNGAAINVTGNLTLNGGAGAVTFNLPTTSVSGGTYHLIQFGSGIVNTNGFRLGTSSLLTGQTAQLQVNGNYLDYVVPPTLASTTPATSGTVLAPVASLVAIFDETVVAGSGNIELRRSSDNSLVEAFDVTLSSQLVFSGAQLTIHPTNDLAPGHYYVLIPAGAVQDVSGNSFHGLGIEDWSFTVASVLLRGSAGAIFGDANDCEVQFTLSTPPYVINDLTSGLLFCGSAGSVVGKERCPVFPLQLPDLGPVTNPFAAAAFSFDLASFVNTPIAKVNLYGLARRGSATVLTNDYWTATGTVDPSPNATLLETNLMTPASPLGLITTTGNGSINLVNFLNAQYAGGAGAGQYVFLRLSTDREETGNANRYQITSAEGAEAVSNLNLWPQINYTLNPTGAVLRVESRADGTGGVVPATSLMSGTSLTNYAIVRSDGAFQSNAPAIWLLTNIIGSVVSADLVASPDGRSAVFTASGSGSARIVAVGGSAPVLVPSGVVTVLPATNQTTRPFIWVRNSDRAAILEKITNNAWAGSLFSALVASEAGNVAQHAANRDAFIRNLPVNWSSSPPVLIAGGNRSALETNLNLAQDCSVLYYLTGDTNYASVAADILYNAVEAFVPLAPSTSAGNGGWFIPGDFNTEARVTGSQMPIIYDFLYSYLQSNLVYSVAAAGMVPFNFPDAQYVFGEFYTLATTHGQTGSNWSALEAPCLVNNLLALDDPVVRSNDLQIYLIHGTSHEDSLKTEAARYVNPGDIWPESLQYSSAVNTIDNVLMALLERYDSSLALFNTYSNLPLSLPRIDYLVYPNNDLQVDFGDGFRAANGTPFFSYEAVYSQAVNRGYTNLANLFGPLINDGVTSGAYDRSAMWHYSSLGPHNDPLKLLWFTPKVVGDPTAPVLPRTDTLPYAGIALQRNLSPAGSNYGLMCFVGGAAHVHSHACGMNMELYGLGQVMGDKSGRTSYGDPINEDYYRVFASDNNIIVNGASRGEGPWGGFGINPVQVVSMEPRAFAPAVSSNFSFTCTSFADTMGTLAEGTEQRTLAIVRTSPTNGYYMDIFRSKSTVTTQVATTLNGSVTNQFHDYLYHNFGDSLTLTETNGTALPLFSQPARFQNDIGDANSQPGWDYFSNTVVSYPTGQPVLGRFVATVSGQALYMDLHIPAVTTREYARVTAPAIVEAPGTYSSKPSPALVMREIGDAWNQPFAVVYEPHYGPANSGTVTNVTALEQDNVLVGLKVESVVGGRNLVQYVFSSASANGTYTNVSLGLAFKGRFGIASDNGDGTTTLYLGDGSFLSYGGNSVAVAGGTNSAAQVQFVPGQSPVVSANTPVNIVTASVPTFTAVSPPVNGVISFTASGSPGAPYTLWSRTNLTTGSWTPLSSGTMTSSSFILQVTNSSGVQQRYYRLSTP